MLAPDLRMVCFHLVIIWSPSLETVHKRSSACMLRTVWLFVTPSAVAHQSRLPMELSRQEYWSGLPFPPPRDFPTQG